MAPDTCQCAMGWSGATCEEEEPVICAGNVVIDSLPDDVPTVQLCHEISGALIIRNIPNASSFSLPRLTTIGGDFLVDSGVQGLRILMPALRKIGGELAPTSSIAELGIGSLEEVGSLRLTKNLGIPWEGFEASGGTIWEFANLRTIGAGGLRFVQCQEMYSFPRLESVGTDIEVVNSAAGDCAIALPSLTQIRDLIVGNQTSLSVLDMPQLLTVRDVSITESRLVCLGIGHVQALGQLHIANNTRLVELGMSALESVDYGDFGDLDAGRKLFCAQWALQQQVTFSTGVAGALGSDPYFLDGTETLCTDFSPLPQSCPMIRWRYSTTYMTFSFGDVVAGTTVQVAPGARPELRNVGVAQVFVSRYRFSGDPAFEFSSVIPESRPGIDTWVSASDDTIRDLPVPMNLLPNSASTFYALKVTPSSDNPIDARLDLFDSQDNLLLSLVLKANY